MSEITNILEFLGEENEEKIKTELTNQIIYNLQESINNEFYVTPDFLADQLAECYDKIFKKHKKEITNAMEQRILKMIANIANAETNIEL